MEAQPPSSRRSYDVIHPDEVHGWEFFEDVPRDLLTVRVSKPNGDSGWAQPADTRSESLVLPVQRDGDRYLVGVEVVRNPMMRRHWRGKPEAHFPGGISVSAIPMMGLPSGKTETEIGEFYANPKHDLYPTTVYLDNSPVPRKGIHYLGEEDLRELIEHSIVVDTRILAALLLAREKQGVRLSTVSRQAQFVFERMQEVGVTQAEVIGLISRQTILGMVHLLTCFESEKGIEEQRVVRVENGTTGTPGMVLPLQNETDAIGLISCWDPLSGNGHGAWNLQLPGGLGGRRRELLEETGAQIITEKLLPLVVANPAHEAYDTDVSVAKVEQKGTQELDDTEKGMMGKPAWFPRKAVLDGVKRGTITDGRTLGIIQMHTLLSRS
jgi:hypothetical protein